MAIDVTNLVNSLGINLASGTNQHTANAVSNQGGKAAKPSTSFGSNVLSSVGHAAGDFVGGIGASLGKSVLDTAHGISQGLPGIGSIAQNQKNYNTRQASIDYAAKSYARQFKSGKISKERYNKLTTDLTKEQKQIDAELQGQAKDYVKPKDFAVGLATTGTLPLAGGRLVAGGRLGAVASKIPAATGMAPAEASRGFLGSAALAPAKSALMYQPTAQSAAEIPGQIKSEDIKGAATNAALLATPLAVAGASKVLPKVAGAVKTAVYGKSAGPIKAFFGGKKVEQAIAKNPEIQKVLKQAEDFTKDQPAVRSGKMAPDQFFKQHLADTLKLDPKSMSVQDFAKRFTQYAKPVEQLNKLKSAGKIDSKYVLTADFKTAVPQAISKISPDFEGLSGVDRAAIAQKVGDQVAGENPTLADAVRNAVFNSQNIDEVKSNLTALDKLNKAKVPGYTPPKGFMLTFGPKDQAALTNIADVSGELEKGKGAAPVFGAVGKLLEKSGLSTQSNNAAMYASYKTHLTDELQKAGMNASEVLSKLTDYTKTARGGVGVFDERQLGTHALKQALGTGDSAQANAVKKAILTAYDRMTLGDLGAAGKLENALYKVPLYGQYRRIQGIGRYELNPFFRLQSAVEAELLSQRAAGGKTLNLPGTNALRQIFSSGSADELGGIARKVTGKLNEGYAGEGAADSAAGVITAKLTRSQEYSIGGLVKTLAQKSGKSVDDFLATADTKTIDTIREVVQYPQRGFTSSNFAKAMNMLVFPSRYNVKLATIAGKAFVDMPPLMQIGTLKGLSNLSDYMNSDAGIKWQSDNAELLGVLNYLNPANNLAKVFQGLKTDNLSISDLGLIGGLPLGVITQIVKTQSGVSTQPPYLNPKTGELVPDKVPANTAGALKLLIIDVINSMYGFPGRTFGASLSKNDITQSIPGLKLGKEDTKDASGQLTPEQQRTQSILKSAPSKALPQSQDKPPQRFATTYGNTPASGTNKQLQATIKANSKSKTKKAKVKAFRPRPL